MTQKFAVRFALLGLLLLASCAGEVTPSAGQNAPASASVATPKPHYLGPIEPIATPLLLRYRPFPVSPSRKVEETTFEAAPDRMRSTEIASGRAEMSARGRDLMLMVSLDSIESSADGQPASASASAEPKPVIRILMSERGEMRAMDVEIPGLGRAEFDVRAKRLDITGFERMTADERAVLQAVGGKIAELMADLVPKLPEAGVQTGDTMYETSFDLGRYFGVGGENPVMRMRVVGTVFGRTIHRGRAAVVVDIAGTIQAASTREKFALSAVLVGYGLMDIATGVWLISETQMDGRGFARERPMTIFVREVNEVRLGGK